MIDTIEINHHIQKHILSILLHQKIARFREMRPPKTDTNLYSYHLKLLQKADIIAKTNGGYQLTPKGLAYIDRVNAEKFFIRQQPKIVTMLVIQNSEGDILLQKRTKQPYIDCWTLPYGKLHINDESLIAAAQREAFEKLGLANQKLTHAGDCYIRVKNGEDTISNTLAHIFRFERDNIATSDTIQWARPHKLKRYQLAPAVEQIMTRTFFHDHHFFEEFEEDWYNEIMTTRESHSEIKDAAKS